LYAHESALSWSSLEKQTVPKTIPEYEVYAIKYARRESTRNQNLLFADLHDGPMPIDYYVWAIVNDERAIVVDIGFDAAEAQARGRQYLRCPAESLAQIGIQPKDVKVVILTHLHYDHCGNLDRFPEARFFLQDREMAFATGRNMLHDILRHAYTLSHVQALIGAVYDKRVVFVDPNTEIAPGVTVHHVGGHTDGLQIVRVRTRRGWIVLASDAAHFYANIDIPNPYPVLYSVGDMLRGFDTIRALADSPAHIIPGHDPLVMERFSAQSAASKGVVARLDADPIHWPDRPIPTSNRTA
jgi:glyoxylase-like metal-dependent hydrolase (beta-lactamase superfamily II)